MRQLDVENEALFKCNFVSVSIFLKACVDDHGDSFSLLQERRI